MSESDMESYMPHIFSTEDLNVLFQECGFRRQFWSYASSPHLMKLGAGDFILLQNGISESAYILNFNGTIQEIPMNHGPGLYFFKEDGAFVAKWEPSGKGKGLLLRGRPLVELLDREIVPVLDINTHYLARRYASSDGAELFKIISLDDQNLVYQGEGRILYLESNIDSFTLVVYNRSEDIFLYKELTIHRPATLKKEIKISVPDGVRKGYVFGFSDLGTRQKKMSFIEYTVPGGYFQKDRLWLYDLNEQSFMNSIVLKNKKGHVFSVFKSRD